MVLSVSKDSGSVLISIKTKTVLTPWAEVDCDPVALWFRLYADEGAYVPEHQGANPARYLFFVTDALDVGDDYGL